MQVRSWLHSRPRTQVTMCARACRFKLRQPTTGTSATSWTMVACVTCKLSDQRPKQLRSSISTQPSSSKRASINFRRGKRSLTLDGPCSSVSPIARTCAPSMTSLNNSIRRPRRPLIALQKMDVSMASASSKLKVSMRHLCLRRH